MSLLSGQEPRRASDACAALVDELLVDGLHDHADGVVAGDVAGSAEGILSDVQSHHDGADGAIGVAGLSAKDHVQEGQSGHDGAAGSTGRSHHGNAQRHDEGHHGSKADGQLVHQTDGSCAGVLLLRHWILYNQRVDEIQSATLHSELKFLKNQINPHFLFNMLNNANVLIRKNPAEASKVLFKLEDLLRYQMNDNFREHVPLRSDIHFLNDYLNLEKVRRDHFDYNITEEGNIDGIQLPALLFIPFVENAVKHNFDSEHPSYVHLFFKVDDNQLEFLCENSKPAIATGKSRVGGIGLTNIRRRLELLYIGRYLLEVSETANKYVVNLKLNL